MEENNNKTARVEPRANPKKIIFVVCFATIVLLLLVAARQAWPYLFESEANVVQEGTTLEIMAEDLGNPTCLHWVDESWLLVCDKGGNLLALHLVDDTFSSPITLLDNLNSPHGTLHWIDSNSSARLFVSQSGTLQAWDILSGDNPSEWELSSPQTLVEGVATGNHQQNAIMPGFDDKLIWHSGSTCNVCEESDWRSATLLEVDPWNGNHTIIASGVRNSYDGTWVPEMGYVFTDNGRDWEGEDYPDEEINLLQIGENYGWPLDGPDNPHPNGTIAPISTWTPHSSINGIDVRPQNSTLPGGNTTVYVTVFGSWNTVVPVGKEIIRVDFSQDEDGNWKGEASVVIEDLSTPLALRFHPNGDLYFADYAHGTIYRYH